MIKFSLSPDFGAVHAAASPHQRMTRTRLRPQRFEYRRRVREYHPGPVTAGRHGTARRFSLIANAMARMANTPSADCRFGIVDEAPIPRTGSVIASSARTPAREGDHPKLAERLKSLLHRQ